MVIYMHFVSYKTSAKFFSQKKPHIYLIIKIYFKKLERNNGFFSTYYDVFGNGDIY